MPDLTLPFDCSDEHTFSSIARIVHSNTLFVN